jgi:hypothetical protein
MSASDDLLNSMNTAAMRFGDRSKPAVERVVALKWMLGEDPTRAKHLLLGVAIDDSEPDDVLVAVGEVLGQLCWAGLVSEFGMRDLTEIAGEMIDTWEP